MMWFPRPPEWTLRSRCGRPDVDPDLWFSDDPAEREHAKRLCATQCPVRARCAAQVIDREHLYRGPGRETHGVRAGVDLPGTPADTNTRLAAIAELTAIAEVELAA